MRHVRHVRHVRYARYARYVRKARYARYVRHARYARYARYARSTRAPRVYFVGVVLQKGVVAHQALIRGHCITFWLIVPSLQVASSFACSVASLSHSPDY